MRNNITQLRGRGTTRPCRVKHNIGKHQNNKVRPPSRSNIQAGNQLDISGRITVKITEHTIIHRTSNSYDSYKYTLSNNNKVVDDFLRQ